MKKVFKWLLVLVVVLSLGVSYVFIGCKDEIATTDTAVSAESGTDEDTAVTEEVSEEEEDEVVAEEVQEYYLLSILAGHEYWIDLEWGFKDAAEIFDVEGIYTGPADYDIQAQVAQMEQLLAKNPAGIALIPGDETQLNDTIAKAIDMGVPVVNLDHDAPPSEAMAFLGTTWETGGRAAGKALAEAMGGKGELFIATVAGCTSCKDRDDWVLTELAENYPDIKLVGTGESGADAQICAETVAAALQAHPNLTGVFVGDDGGGIGAAQAVVEAGKKGEVHVVCFGKTNAFFEKVENEEIYALIAQVPYNMGFWGLTYLYMVKNDLINLPFDWQKAGVSPLPGYTNTNSYVVTKDNVDAFWRERE